MKLINSPKRFKAVLLLVAALHFGPLSATARTLVSSESVDNSRILQQQQQQQVVVRGTTFSTHQELSDAVDVYLEFQHADETSKRPDIALVYEQLLDKYGPVEHWDVGRLDDFGNLFNTKRNPLAALATPDLSQWNVGHNIDRPLYLQDMFLGATSINFNVQYWKTDNAVHFNGMFENCVSFEGFGLETWNVANGKLFMSLFSGCTALHRNLDLSMWQLQSAERLDAMFRQSSYGGTVGSDLCAWNDSLRSTATVKDMFLQSECQSTADPNLAERNDPTAELSLCSPCDKSQTTSSQTKPNVLLIMADQMRFDMIRHVQDELDHYRDAYKIETPNLDRLLQSGAYFKNVYVSIQ